MTEYDYRTPMPAEFELAQLDPERPDIMAHLQSLRQRNAAPPPSPVAPRRDTPPAVDYVALDARINQHLDGLIPQIAEFMAEYVGEETGKLRKELVKTKAELTKLRRRLGDEVGR